MLIVQDPHPLDHVDARVADLVGLGPLPCEGQHPDLDFGALARFAVVYEGHGGEPCRALLCLPCVGPVLVYAWQLFLHLGAFTPPDTALLPAPTQPVALDWCCATCGNPEPDSCPRIDSRCVRPSTVSA